MRCRLLCVSVIAVLFAALLGCSAFGSHERKEEEEGVRLALSAVPAPARTTIQTLTAGGEIRKIEKEEKDDTTIYDVEARVGDKDVEYDVDSSGNVLTSEESVPYDSLPTAVRATVEGYFGSSTGLKASREVEEGKTFYEVEGRRDGAKTSLKLTEAGRIVEEEHD